MSSKDDILFDQVSAGDFGIAKDAQGTFQYGLVVHVELNRETGDVVEFEIAYRVTENSGRQYLTVTPGNFYSACAGSYEALSRAGWANQYLAAR